MEEKEENSRETNRIRQRMRNYIHIDKLFILTKYILISY